MTVHCSHQNLVVFPLMNCYTVIINFKKLLNLTNNNAHRIFTIDKIHNLCHRGTWMEESVTYFAFQSFCYEYRNHAFSVTHGQ